MNQVSNIINPFIHNNYTQLAKVYKMKREKFSWIIEPIRDHIKKEDPFRNTLTWEEVWIIVEDQGVPGPFNGIDPLKYNCITKLAKLYQVDRYTFSRWIEPIRYKIKKENPNRTYLTPAEVKLIIDYIGLPKQNLNESTKELKGDFSEKILTAKNPCPCFGESSPGRVKLLSLL